MAQALAGERLLRVEEGARERGDLDADSRTLYVAYHSEPADQAPTNAEQVAAGHRVAGVPHRALAPDLLEVVLYWQTDAPIGMDYNVFCHVLAGDQMIGQDDGPPAMGTIRPHDGAWAIW